MSADPHHHGGIVRTVAGRIVPEAGHYQIDPGFSLVRFRVRRLWTPVNGFFSSVAGALTIADDPLQSSLTIEIATDSLWLGHPGTLAAARSADLLAVDEHPRATFVSAEILPLEDGSWEMLGGLSVRGVVRDTAWRVRFLGAAVHPLSRTPTLTFEADTTIDRRDFGLDAHQVPVPGAMGAVVVGNSIELHVDLEATPAAPR